MIFSAKNGFSKLAFEKLSPFANSLWQLNGQAGQPADYMYQVHIMLDRQDLVNLNTGNDPPEWVNSMTDEQLAEFTNFNLNSFLPAWQTIESTQQRRPKFKIRC